VAPARGPAAYGLNTGKPPTVDGDVGRVRRAEPSTSRCSFSDAVAAGDGPRDHLLDPGGGAEGRPRNVRSVDTKFHEFDATLDFDAASPPPQAG
jgi:hypothetical protein